MSPRTALHKVLEFDKDYMDASTSLADVRQKQGRFDDAVELMERLVFSVDDRDISLRCYLGNAYAMAGRTEDARKQLVEMQRLAVTLQPRAMASALQM